MNFFGLLQCAMALLPWQGARLLYGYASSEGNKMIDRYIYFYNYERIQLKIGEAPASDASPPKTQYFLSGFLCTVHNLEIVQRPFSSITEEISIFTSWG